MQKDVIRSGVTFEKTVYEKLDKIVSSSKRYKIDKSEIINAIINSSNLSVKQVQKLVMDWRDKE